MKVISKIRCCQEAIRRQYRKYPSALQEEITDSFYCHRHQYSSDKTFVNEPNLVLGLLQFLTAFHLFFLWVRRSLVRDDARGSLKFGSLQWI